MSLDFARLRLDNAKQRVNNFIDDHIIEWTTDEIVKAIQDNARGLGLSQRVIQAITAEKTDFMKAEIVFDLQDEDSGADLSDLLEKGSRPHIIEPKGRDAGGANWLRWMNDLGNPVFRRRVQHPGFKGYQLIEKGVEQNEQELQRRIEREVTNFMERERL